MAGHTISLYLQEQGHEVYGFDLHESKLIKSFACNAFDTETIAGVIKEGKYDTVINCIGVLNQFAENDHAMAEKYDMPVLYSCYPRSQKMIEKREFKFNEKVIQHKPLGFFDYNKLQQNAFCVVSDSGTVPEEGAFFGFPAVSIRTSTEHPEAMDNGVFTIGSINSEQVLQTIDLAVSMHANGDDACPVPSYVDENVIH